MMNGKARGVYLVLQWQPFITIALINNFSHRRPQNKVPLYKTRIFIKFYVQMKINIKYYLLSELGW